MTDEPLRPAGMVNAGRYLILNAIHVESMEWDQQHYANGPGDSVLIIRMVTGKEHRIRHEPHYLGGTDARAVEKAICDALKPNSDHR